MDILGRFSHLSEIFQVAGVCLIYIDAGPVVQAWSFQRMNSSTSELFVENCFWVTDAEKNFSLQIETVLGYLCPRPITSFKRSMDRKATEPKCIFHQPYNLHIPEFNKKAWTQLFI